MPTLRTTDEARRRLTITVAGGIVGSALSLCVLSWSRSFDADYFHNGCDAGLDPVDLPAGRPLHSVGRCGNLPGPPWCLQDCKITVFGRVVERRTFPEDVGFALIRKWRLRVIGILLVVGGTFGGLVGSLRIWSRGPALALKPWHWLIGPVALFVGLVLIGFSRETHSLFVRVLDPYMTIPSIDPPIKWRDAFLEAVGLGVFAAVVGWAGTVVVVAWRKLLPWTWPADAADYDDWVTPNPR